MMFQNLKLRRFGAAMAASMQAGKRCSASPVKARPFRVGVAGVMALLLALPTQSWAQAEPAEPADQAAQEEGWPFDPQERYEAAQSAFEVQEYRLAIELWMDILSHPKCSELGGDMVRTLGQNLVSAIEASFKRASIGERGRQSAAYKKIFEDATRFCGVYEYFQEGETYSETVEDTCLRWSEQEAPQESPMLDQADPSVPSSSSLAAEPSVTTPQATTTYPVAPSRPPQLRAGIALLASAGVASTFSMIGMIAEGRAMRNYHTSIHKNEVDPALRERADAWRTAAVVSGGVSLALVTVGAVLCLAGTRPHGLAARQRKKKGVAWRLLPSGVSMRF